MTQMVYRAAVIKSPEQGELSSQRLRTSFKRTAKRAVRQESASIKYLEEGELSTSYKLLSQEGRTFILIMFRRLEAFWA